MSGITVSSKDLAKLNRLQFELLKQAVESLTATAEVIDLNRQRSLRQSKPVSGYVEQGTKKVS